MRDYSFTEINRVARRSGEMRNKGIFITHGTGFVLLLLAVCLAVLVGLIVHFASPGTVVCKCYTPKPDIPSLSPEELKGQCTELIKGGDLEICTKCPKESTQARTETTKTMMMTTTTTAATTTMMPTTTTPAPKINYRLPTAVKPIHYVLELQPEIYGIKSSLFTFNGTVKIIINVTETTSNITMHRKDINITTGSLVLSALDSSSTAAPVIINTSHDEVREFYILHLDGDLDPGRSYEIGMSFHGQMGRGGSGLFSSSYKDNNNNIVYLATTQFQTVQARKAFPCFDEPALKATFDITLVRKNNTDRDYRTLANTDAIGHEKRGDYVADIYARTPVMSTYLLAFIVCDFDHLENITANITYRTFARPNAIQRADRAHKYGLDLFNWFEKTFDPDYPISKLDSIAIPAFSTAGMENWGLITYRETILYEPGIYPALADSGTVRVVSHEIAHQWFGNIVTPKWWWWIWLNESLVSFLDFFAVEAVYPARRSSEQFIVHSMHAAFVVDGVRTSRPMTNDAESRRELNRIFNSVIYSKGACVVRMMHFAMGSDMFIKGLNLYIKRHQYSVAEQQDLWDALTEISVQEGSPINVTDIMAPWVTQMNYPLVTVRVVGPGVISVTQERFLNDMNENTTGDTAPYNYRWSIPITIASSANSSNFEKTYNYNEIKWLHHTETEKNISDAIIPDPTVADSWVLVNFHQRAFYRVNYEERTWMALVKHLEMNPNTFPPAVRAQLLNDAWALNKAGRLKMEIALRTLNFLKHETDYIPWRAFPRENDYIDIMLERSDIYGAFKEYMKLAVSKTYNHYRMDIDEDTLPLNIRQTARGSSYACKYGVPECAEDSLRLFRAWKNDTVNNRLDPDLLRTIICNAVRYGGMEEWNFVYDQYWNGDLLTIRSNSLRGMACAKQPWLIKRMLNMAFDKTKIKSSHPRLLISYISQEPGSREITWNFIKENYMMIAANLPRYSISSMIRDASTAYNTDYFLHELKTFANMTTDLKAYSIPLSRAIQTTQTNIKWMTANYGIIKDWLIEQGFGHFIP